MQNIELSRVLLAFGLQLFVSILFFFLAYKVLKRKRSHTTLILGVYYILPAITFMLNIFIIFVPLNSPFIGYFLYYLAAFFIFFGQGFIVIFLIILLYSDYELEVKKPILIICAYAFFIIILLIIPDGIILDVETNFTPTYSWIFLITSYIFLTLFVYLPTSMLSIKLFKTFKEKNLKKKLKFFIFGVIGMAIAMYGLILYNTWQNEIFRGIWTITVFFVVVPSGILIYYGIGHNL